MWCLQQVPLDSVRRFLSILKSKPRILHPPILFPLPCHFQKVFKIFVAPFLPVLVKLVKNSHFYNVNLSQNLKIAITFFGDVRLSWYPHDWVCMLKLFPWIPITGILVLALDLAIGAIYGHFGHLGHIYLAIWAIYGSYGHDHRPKQYARYGYPGKEQTDMNTTM